MVWDPGVYILDIYALQGVERRKEMPGRSRERTYRVRRHSGRRDPAPFLAPLFPALVAILRQSRASFSRDARAAILCNYSPCRSAKMLPLSAGALRAVARSFGRSARTATTYPPRVGR